MRTEQLCFSKELLSHVKSLVIICATETPLEGTRPISLLLQLLYFCPATDAYEGFLRALSVATGTPMPRILKTDCKLTQSRPASQVR